MLAMLLMRRLRVCVMNEYMCGIITNVSANSEREMGGRGESKIVVRRFLAGANAVIVRLHILGRNRVHNVVRHHHKALKVVVRAVHFPHLHLVHINALGKGLGGERFSGG